LNLNLTITHVVTLLLPSTSLGKHTVSAHTVKENATENKQDLLPG